MTESTSSAIGALIARFRRPPPDDGRRDVLGRSLRGSAASRDKQAVAAVVERQRRVDVAVAAAEAELIARGIGVARPSSAAGALIGPSRRRRS